MENNKRYTILVFTSKIDFLIPMINRLVNMDTPFFQHCSVENTFFISFYSKLKLDAIKTIIKKQSPGLHYLIFDITTRGETFDLEYEGLDDLLLLTNVDQELKKQEEEQNETKVDLDDLLELVNKNGWKSLSEEQKQKLEDFSNE